MTAARLGTLVVLALCACGPRPPVERPEAQALRVRCEPGDASVSVDDRVVGSCGSLRDRNVPIMPGFHRVEVRAERHFTRFLEVDVPRLGRAAVEATLRPRPDVP